MSGRTFHFTLDGTPFTVDGGACTGAISASPGAHTIKETPPAGIEVSRIAANRVISKDVAGGSVTVNVRAGSTPANETLVTFTNREFRAVGLKICKQTPDATLLGDLFSFTRNGGPASSVAAGPIGAPNCSQVYPYALHTQVNIDELPVPNTEVSNITVSDGRGSNFDTANGTVTATIGAGVTVVTYTNRVPEQDNFGFIEVCKIAGDQFVSGNFDFTITDSSGVPRNRTVLVGQCSEPVQVRAGNVNVAEAARSPYYVSGIYVAPAGRLVTSNLANGTVTVVVPKGDESTETAVFYKNSTRTGLVKVCKTLAANSSALTGKTFSFDMTDVAGGRTVSVVASPPGQTACVIVQQPLPIGSPVSITERAVANVRNTNVSVSPASQNDGSAPPTANLRVGSGITTATFTNQAYGTIEICKVAADASTATQTFQFSINGGAAINVKAGQCSNPIPVPAGTASVFELAKANFHLVSTTAVGPAGENRLISGPNPASVSVPFGGVENETVVTFTNEVDKGSFKICKHASDTGLANVSFPFRYDYTVYGVPKGGDVNLKPGECSGIIGGIPVVDPAGAPIPIVVTEGAIGGTLVENITVVNGRNVIASPANRTVTFSVNQGVTTVNFYNARTPLVDG